MDVRPGGVWRFLMRSKEYGDFPNKIVYLEAARPQRLVYTHGSDGADDEPDFTVIVTFDDEGGKTRLTMHSLFASVEACAKVKAFGAVELGQQTIDKLEEYLAGLPANTRT